MRRKLITISIPVYNEVDNVAPLLQRLRALATECAAYDFEFLFTDNASNDGTFDTLAEEARKDQRIRVLRFTRNFGFQLSILANYLHAKGDAAIQIDADLQDPPELIPEFLSAWEKGYKVVYGIRKSRKENALLNGARRIYYRLLRRLSTAAVPIDAGDFRLIDRVIIEHLRKSNDNSPYLRGMIAEFGYAQIGIPYDRSGRSKGVSKFRLPALIRLAIDGVCSQSTKPLEVITIFGFILSFLSFLATIFYFVWFLLYAENATPGFTTIVILMLLSTGLNAAFVGVLGEYIGRIFRNTRELHLPILEHRIESGDLSLATGQDLRLPLKPETQTNPLT
ncbi:MAG: glycosyltransferase family 2 protein [Hyphomicrobium sp.]